MEFVQNLDHSKLVLAQTALSFLIAPFASPNYNFPIFLFGVYVSENVENALSTQVFTSVVGLSFFSDLIWMGRNEQNGFVKLFTIIIMLLKVPTFLVFVGISKAHGGGIGNLGIRGGDLSGPTVWSMPGGFTSGGREGYQNVDEEAAVRVPSHAPGPVPQGPPSLSQPVHPPAPAAPGSYQAA